MYVGIYVHHRGPLSNPKHKGMDYNIWRHYKGPLSHPRKRRGGLQCLTTSGAFIPPEKVQGPWCKLTCVVGILFLDIFLVIFDTYFLRARHYFAGKFYPERVRPRAVWLYNHIMRRRGGILKSLFFNVFQNSKNTFQSTIYDTIVAR